MDRPALVYTSDLFAAGKFDRENDCPRFPKTPKMARPTVKHSKYGLEDEADSSDDGSVSEIMVDKGTSMIHSQPGTSYGQSILTFARTWT